MLEVENVSVACGDKKILDQVSFSVGPGETVSIVGESGSGKSTLLKAITGLLADGVRLCKGTVTFEGMELSSMDPDGLRSLRGAKIAMVYQQAGRSMDPVTKIGSQFYEALRTKGRLSRSESDRKAIACMEQLSLKEPGRILHTYPVMLSGGTNQRVAIALAMVMEPSLILADEPTSALDVTVQAEVVETMKKLRENSSASILMVTHNMGVVAQMSDRVGVMYKGRMPAGAVQAAPSLYPPFDGFCPENGWECTPGKDVVPGGYGNRLPLLCEMPCSCENLRYSDAPGKEISGRAPCHVP